MTRQIAACVDAIEVGETTVKQLKAEKAILKKALTVAKNSEKKIAKAKPVTLYHPAAKPKAKAKASLTEAEIANMTLSERQRLQKAELDKKFKAEKAIVKAEIRTHVDDHHNRAHADEAEELLESDRKYYTAKHEFEMFRAKFEQNATRKDMEDDPAQRRLVVKWNALKASKMSAANREQNMIAFLEGRVTSSVAEVSKESATAEEEKVEKAFMLELMRNHVEDVAPVMRSIHCY